MVNTRHPYAFLNYLAFRSSYLGVAVVKETLVVSFVNLG